MGAYFYITETLFDSETIQNWKNITHFTGNIITNITHFIGNITTKQSLNNYRMRWHKSIDTENPLVIHMRNSETAKHLYCLIQ
jgi:hypothetical protein